MDKTTNETLIALFEMLNDRLYNIEQTNNTIVKHLKNQCIKKCILDKDLFGFPIDVHTHDHGVENINKDTLVYVSVVFVTDELIHHLSLCNKQVFSQILSFLPTILTEEQITTFKAHIAKKKSDNPFDMITCEEFGIQSIFRDLEHHVLNEYVTRNCKNIQQVVPAFDYYDFIVLGAASVEEVVASVTNVFQTLNCPLKSILVSQHDHMNVVACCSKYWKNFEICCNGNIMAYNWETASGVLDLTQKNVEDYIKYLEDACKNDRYGTAPSCSDKDSVQCNLDTLRDMYYLLFEENEEEYEEDVDDVVENNGSDDD
jgi:hypothetical protein